MNSDAQMNSMLQHFIEGFSTLGCPELHSRTVNCPGGTESFFTAPFKPHLRHNRRSPKFIQMFDPHHIDPRRYDRASKQSEDLLN